jgi:chromosomal replication initiation ATPase DnaA
LVKQFSDRQIEIEPEIVDYILPRIERTAAGIRHVVAALDRLTLSQGRRLTKAVVAHYLRDTSTEFQNDKQIYLNLAR